MQESPCNADRHTDRRESVKAVRRVVALILAAGYSSRMGALKPLLRIGGFHLVEAAVSRFMRAGFQDVRVVVGHRAQEIIPAVDRLGVEHIYNPFYSKGMFSSVLAGVGSLGIDVEAFFVLPVDIPLVKSETIAQLYSAYQNCPAVIVYPRFQGYRGHPPLISMGTMTKDLRGDFPGGLRALLRKYEEDALDVDVEDEAVLMDCDTQEDYSKLWDYYLKDFDASSSAPDGNNFINRKSKFPETALR
jgi:molybdenum cofactor cytidylyltransferase